MEEIIKLIREYASQNLTKKKWEAGKDLVDRKSTRLNSSHT